jgi:hypothetical protein
MARQQYPVESWWRGIFSMTVVSAGMALMGRPGEDGVPPVLATPYEKWIIFVGGMVVISLSVIIGTIAGPEPKSPRVN